MSSITTTVTIQPTTTHTITTTTACTIATATLLSALSGNCYYCCRYYYKDDV